MLIFYTYKTKYYVNVIKENNKQILSYRKQWISESVQRLAPLKTKKEDTNLKEEEQN